MRPLPQSGVFEDRGFIWTKNRDPGRSIYGEKLRLFKNTEYRSWHPGRSKMGALLRKDPRTTWPKLDEDVLYLGASTGTTVSHLSDIMQATIFAVEFSARSVRDLLWNVEPRDNVVPIFDDASRPERYHPYFTDRVGTLIQDVAQRHQVEIFLANMDLVRPGGKGYLFVKARSIHVADAPRDIYARVKARLEEAGLRIDAQVDLEPFEKDHCAFVVTKP